MSNRTQIFCNRNNLIATRMIRVLEGWIKQNNEQIRNLIEQRNLLIVAFLESNTRGYLVDDHEIIRLLNIPRYIEQIRQAIRNRQIEINYYRSRLVIC